MSLNDETRSILVERELGKSDAFFDQAIKNAELQIWDVVANRLYYSLFHAVCALLVNDGYNVGSHKGAVAQFGLHYVVEGKFPKEDGQFYSRLQGIREKADYSLSWNSAKVDFHAAIKNTEEMIARIKQQISQ